MNNINIKDINTKELRENIYKLTIYKIYIINKQTKIIYYKLIKFILKKLKQLYINL